MRFTPAEGSATSTASLAPQYHSEFGVQDTFRNGLVTVKNEYAETHPLKNHLEQVMLLF
jgi:hypothetical protein